MKSNAETQSAQLPALAGDTARESIMAINKKRISKIFGAATSSAKFRWNQVAYRMRNVEKQLVAIRDKAFAYYSGTDENGMEQGGNPHWIYFSKPFENPEAANDAQKYHALRAALSRLPAGPALKFHTAPMLEDKEVVRSAFVDAGFKCVNRPTFLYKPANDNFEDLIREFKSDTRSKVRRAQRELDITTMEVEDFFTFYKDNLDKRGEIYRWFALDLDEKVLKQALAEEEPDVEIIAARRKETPENPGPHPVDAAILFSRGADGFSKLLRVCYRVQKEDDGLPPPHDQANKLLVTEIMLRAGKRNVTVDTDGFTPGGERLYMRFGVFERHDQDIFSRVTIGNTARLLVNKIEPLIAKYM